MAYTKPYGGRSRKQEADDGVKALRERLKSGDVTGVYVFRGEEEYMKKYYFGELAGASGDTGANVSVLDGDNFSVEKLCDMVYTAPTADYAGSFFDDAPSAPASPSIRVIKVVSPSLTGLSDREETRLLELSEDSLSCCVVFYYGYQSAEDEKKFTKGLLKKLWEHKNVTSVEFLHESPQSASLAKWVKRHFDNGHTSVSAETVSYLIGQVGADMSTLLFEIEKLCAYASAEKKEAVTKEDVDFVCIKNTDARIEDISRAVLDGVYSDAVRALAILLREKVAELYIFGAVTNKISELSAVDYYKSQGLYKTDIAAKTGIRDFVVGYHLQSLASLARTRAPGVLGRMIGILDEYDVKFKSSPCDKTILLQDLLLKLCLA